MERILPAALALVCLVVSAAAAAAPQLWVSELDGIQEIDTATNQVVATFTVDLPPDTVLGPAWQAPAGGTLYVAIDNDNKIFELDPQTGQKTGALTLAGPGFGFFSPSRDGTRLYTGLVGDSGGSGASFQSFRLRSGDPIREIDSGEEWFVDAVGPSDARVYAGSRDTNHVYVTDGAGREIAQWTIGSDPLCDPATVLLSDDGRRAFVACRGGSPNFEIIKTKTGDVAHSVDVGLTNLLWAMPAPDGDIWVLGLDGGGTLYVFDSTSLTIKQTKSLGLDLLNYAGMAVSPDGTRFYLSDASPDHGNPAVVVYDASTLQKLATLDVPAIPFIGFHALTRGAFHARSQALATDQDKQLSATLDLGNRTGCTPTYELVESPAHGSLNLDPATGDIVYTPDSGYSGHDVFTWRATAPGSCTAADNPTLPQTNVAAVSVSVDAIGGRTQATVPVGGTYSLDVTGHGVGPWSVSASSSDTGVVRVVSSSCPAEGGDTDCTVELRGVSAGEAQVSVTLEDAYGGGLTQTVAATAEHTVGGSGSGGGASGLPTLAWFVLLAAAGFLRRRVRARN